MNEYTVEDLAADSFFSQPVYLDQGFVVAAPEMPLSGAIKAALEEWGFQTVLSDGGPLGEAPADDAPPAADEEAAAEPTESADAQQLQEAEERYLNFQAYVKSLLDQMRAKIPPQIGEMTEKIKELCDMGADERRCLLRALKNAEPEPEETYLVSHTVKTTILAITIGFSLKLPSHRLVELGIAAMLHEAGMLSLPPEIFMNEGALSREEKTAILSHPIQGYILLKSFNLPLEVTIAALEHHERENGSGYPRKIKGDKIGLYSKIIAVVCAYEAQTSSRPYKAAKDGFAGMLDLLRNEGKQYNDTVIRALVFSLSIYPIGLYVLLSDGRKGQVVGVKAENPRYPIVQLLGVLASDGKMKLLETSPGGVYIVRPLVRDELG